VELTSFTAMIQNSNTLLSWETASEINNDYFIIERSSDGKKFETIATVAGAGNSKIAKRYQYSDQSQISGLQYYRLSQVDFDGQKTQFDILSIYTESAKLKIYPNPAADYVVFNIASENYAVALSDVKGIPCHPEINHVLEVAPGTFGLQVRALETGVYYLQITNLENHQVTHFRFVKN